jgi:long-chain acyl-CoA synthetase
MDKTIIGLFDDSVARYSNNVYLWEKATNDYQGTTYIETKEIVKKLAAGFMSIGLEAGERVALLSEGRNAWIISELAILYAGGCCVPLSVRLDSGTDLKFRLQHSGSRMVVTSSGQAGKIEEIRGLLPELQTVIYIDGVPQGKETGTGSKYVNISYRDLISKGEAYLISHGQLLQKRTDAVQPDDLANISYTSGTTADPKGIMLTHKNYWTNVRQSLTLMNIPPTHRTLAILPWDHSFAHTACLYCFMAMGASVGSVQTGKTAMETIRNVPQNIKELKPHILMSVPALSRNFRKNIELGVEQKGKLITGLFKHALSVAYAYNRDGYNRGTGWRAILKPMLRFYDMLLFKKIRQGFGGELEFFIGGGALLDVEIQRFFYAIGIPVCQGYGLSEAAPVISSNSLDYIKFGTSGKPAGYLSIRILDENGIELQQGEPGEIVICGDNVMKGYWNNPTATAEVLKNGWLYTGDLGYLDNDGYLVVLGRFKSLLIGNDGEKYSPEGIEEAITGFSETIHQCILHNNQQPFTTGLIVPSMYHINGHLEKSGITPGSAEGINTALKLIKHDIDAFFKHGKHAGQFPERWLPSAFVVLPEAFTEQNHMLNSTMKIVRGKAEERYKSEIEFLYTPEARDILNEINRKNLSNWYTSR